jgi:hypothetical protein
MHCHVSFKVLWGSPCKSHRYVHAVALADVLHPSSHPVMYATALKVWQQLLKMCLGASLGLSHKSLWRKTICTSL